MFAFANMSVLAHEQVLSSNMLKLKLKLGPVTCINIPQKSELRSSTFHVMY